MRVLLRVSLSGSRDGVEWPAAGQVVDLPAAEAVSMLDAGLAEPAPAAEVESATVSTKPTRRKV